MRQQAGKDVVYSYRVTHTDSLYIWPRLVIYKCQLHNSKGMLEVYHGPWWEEFNQHHLNSLKWLP